jgi:hypothetical protein
VFEQIIDLSMTTPSAILTLSINIELVILAFSPIEQLRPITERLTSALSPILVPSSIKLSLLTYLFVNLKIVCF